MEPTDAQLSAYLEDALPIDKLAEIEKRLREEPALRDRLAAVIGREDAGLHSVGVIWRRHRLSCPTRDELSEMLLGVLDETHAAYVKFHIEEVGCRYCAANLEDLRHAQTAASKDGDAPLTRRTRYFETSAGHLRKKSN